MKKEFLVGYTGFVGSNLAKEHSFTQVFNSKNIEDAYYKEPDLLVYAGVRAEMFLANNDPEGDLKIIENAEENIRKISAKRVVLISTVAVYPTTKDVDEESTIEEANITAYGHNRRHLEKMVLNEMDNSLVVRLPAIYGDNLKKNFIFDFITRIPALLTEAKLCELKKDEPLIEQCYFKQSNGFYKYIKPENIEEKEVYLCFERLGFSALNFTDSRSIYQFYNLSRLWEDISIALANNLRIVNLVTEPLAVNEIYRALENKEFNNELSKAPFDYNIKTKHAELFGGSGGYIQTKSAVMKDITQFVYTNRARRD